MMPDENTTPWIDRAMLAIMRWSGAGLEDFEDDEPPTPEEWEQAQLDSEELVNLVASALERRYGD